MHILIGVAMTIPFIPKIYAILIPFITILYTYSSNNENEEALFFSFYIVGAEVFIRMTKGVLLYETGKYLVIVLLLIGLFKGKVKNKLNFFFIVYFMIILLGIVLTRVPDGESIRKSILFNLSGPICLGIAAIYFYKREIKLSQLINSLYFALLPLISMVVYLYFRTPDLAEIVFGSSANFETSGGFGPNQVATALGFGIFITTVLILLKVNITSYFGLDIFLLFYFIYRGLLTFSRGGLLTGIIAILVFIIFFTISQKGSKVNIVKYLFLGFVFALTVWFYTSSVTGGMISNRYTNKNKQGVKKEDITTGRKDILLNQLTTFLETPLGIGVGNGKYNRLHSGKKVTAASHNEAGRLLEEHGIFGFATLLGLLIIPILSGIKAKSIEKAFLFSFFIFWFLTINHSAMRIAFPGFIYGLSLIKIIGEEDE